MHIGITRERTKRSIFQVTLKRKRKEKEEEFPVGISEATNLFSIVESSFVVALPQDLVKKGWLLSRRHGSTVRICPLPDDCSQYLHSCSLRWSKEPWRCANKRFSTSSRRANFYIVFPFTGALFLLHFRKNGFESWIYVTDKSPENIPKDLSPPVSANGFSSLSLLSFFLPSFFSYLPFHPPLFSPATRFFQHQQVAR